MCYIILEGLAGVVRVKNSFIAPGMFGYRDMMLNVRMSNGHVAEVQLGFQNGTLRLIQLLDHLDQITRIVLSHVEENPQIRANQFNFTVPVGVDLIEKEL